MNAQFFINEIGCKFNLRKPKSEKPTNVYFVARVRNKQIKLSTGVRVYPAEWKVISSARESEQVKIKRKPFEMSIVSVFCQVGKMQMTTEC